MNYKIINPDFILSNMMNNVDVVKQMIGMFLGQGMEDFRGLKQAIGKEDYTEIKSKAHHIKPTMEYIGASNIRLQFQELESQAAANAAFADIQQIFTKLEQDFNLAMEELEAYASTLS